MTFSVLVSDRRSQIALTLLTMAEMARVKYIFIDVVAFTSGRSVEAQADIVSELNRLVKTSLENVAASPDKVLFLPTGDGMAIAFIDEPSLDIHLRQAVDLLRLIHDRNQEPADKSRAFEVRIAINENVDNIVTDINGQRNIAGMGISTARRIMDQADGGQLLAGQAVYEILRHREQYMSKFRPYKGVGKHGGSIALYQFVDPDATGINNNPPSIFATREASDPKFTLPVAYFVGLAISHRQFFESRSGDWRRDYLGIVLLWFLAEDSVERANTPSFDEPLEQTWKAGKATLEEQYQYYANSDHEIVKRFAQILTQQYLEKYSKHFEGEKYSPNPLFVKPSGLEKLQQEWPRIAQEFGL